MMRRRYPQQRNSSLSAFEWFLAGFIAFMFAFAGVWLSIQVDIAERQSEFLDQARHVEEQLHLRLSQMEPVLVSLVGLQQSVDSAGVEAAQAQLAGLSAEFFIGLPLHRQHLRRLLYPSQ